MTTDNTNTYVTIHWLHGPIPGCSHFWSGHPDSGYHQNGGTGADVLDHINLIFQLKQEWMFLSGVGLSAFCPGVGLNLSRHAHIRQPPLTGCGMGIIAQFAYYLQAFPGMREYPVAFAVVHRLTGCETRSGWLQHGHSPDALWAFVRTSYGIAGC
ncbi:TraX family protein [Escherichia coli]|uniref:TraX family protein n=1 Tax=Escherichia coli TaxID=562 RepID=UPI003F50E01C